MERGLLLNVIVRKRAPVLELLSGEYEGLLRSGGMPSLSWILLLIISIVYFRATRTSRKNKETGKRRLHPLEAKTKTQTSTCASAPSLDQNRSSSHLSVKQMLKCSSNAKACIAKGTRVRPRLMLASVMAACRAGWRRCHDQRLLDLPASRALCLRHSVVGPE